MSNTIHRRRKARPDLVDIFRYYAREAGFRVSQRFIAEAEATFTRLAGKAGMGTYYEHEHPALADRRFVPISRFRKYVVFCRSVADGIDIVRVPRGVRDIHIKLAEQFGIAGNVSDNGSDA